MTCSGIKPARSSPSAVVVHAAAAHSAVPSVNSRPSLISCRSLYFLEQSASSVSSFRRQLKTFLFHQSFPVIIVSISVLHYRGLCNSLGSIDIDISGTVLQASILRQLGIYSDIFLEKSNKVDQFCDKWLCMEDKITSIASERLC